jgi:SAM-dependent methyltransferase
MSEFTYVGSELEIFAHARRWKRYYRSRIEPYMGGDVLEVGAGLGATTETLCGGGERNWVCLEPDGALLSQVERKIAAGALPACCRARRGTVADLAAGEQFDTVLYIDVLEHIEDDAAEVRGVASHVRPGGCLVALGPAHNWLYTPFDKAIGHYRRYNRRMLLALTPPGLRVERAFYLDSAGMALSLANRLLLRQSMPTVKQIQVWDRFVIPVSRVFDRVLFHRLGKTAVCVWRREPAPVPPPSS